MIGGDQTTAQGVVSRDLKEDCAIGLLKDSIYLAG